MAETQSISRSEIERVIQLVNQGDVESLKAQEFEQFQYQGFDPYKIVETLLKAKAAKAISDDDLRKDIFTMVAIGMIKGSVNEHNINKMSDAGKVDLKSLIAKYGIKMGGGKGQPAGIITFPRMMATFPDIAVKLVSVIGPKEFNGGPLLSTRLPDYIKIQVFPAVIPRDIDSDVRRMLLTASLCYSIDQTVQISQIQNPDLKQLSANQANFTNVGYRSPVPSDSVRKAVFDTLKVFDHYQAIALVLEDYKSKIDSSFTIMSESQFKSKFT